LRETFAVGNIAAFDIYSLRGAVIAGQTDADSDGFEFLGGEIIGDVQQFPANPAISKF
jgi:hypothetical protein